MPSGPEASVDRTGESWATVALGPMNASVTTWTTGLDDDDDDDDEVEAAAATADSSRTSLKTAVHRRASSYFSTRLANRHAPKLGHTVSRTHASARTRTPCLVSRKSLRVTHAATCSSSARACTSDRRASVTGYWPERRSAWRTCGRADDDDEAMPAAPAP